MIILLSITSIILATFTAIFLYCFLHYRHRLHAITKTNQRPPIPPAEIYEIDTRFTPTRYGYPLDCEISFIGKSKNLPGGTSDTEGWILSAFAKKAKTIFEFGTCTGKTTYLLAKNSPADAIVITITLGPHQQELYSTGSSDSQDAEKYALTESAFESFLYTGTAEEKKITQLFGDSKQFNEKPYWGKCDLIFIDGSHAYSYIKSDTEKALRMVSPRGIILWHDYRPNHPETHDVYRFLNTLRKKLPVVHIADSTLVAYTAVDVHD